MTVTLLAHTPEPEKLIAGAAKLCYSSSDAETLLDGLTPEKTENFIDMLAEIGHESPIEHSYFTFSISGISRATLAQFTRHRIASFSVQSQCYVKKDGFDYIIPPAIAELPEAQEIFLESMEQSRLNYEKLSAILKDKLFTEFISNGMDEKTARTAAEKKAIEDARFVLPNACDTKLVVTMNARSLMNFFRLRCCERAQWEIRAVANEMLKLCKQVAPHLFAGAGPSCVKGKCPEGSKSCGKMLEMREKYANL